VYALAENVIYRPSHTKRAKEQSDNWLIHEIADYYGVVYTSSLRDTGEDKALYVQDAAMSMEDLAALQHQFQYIMLRDIYKTKNNRQRWRTICQDERFVVVIDLFFFGLLFYRTEQPKQYFRLRYPFWRC